jgi:hypothetical protein
MIQTNRRDFISIGVTLLYTTTGCVSLSGESHRDTSTVEITNQQSAELEGVIRFTYEGEVIVEEPLGSRDENNRLEVEFPRELRQVTLAIELDSPEEQIYTESVPSGVPDYHVTIQSDDIDVVWAEN